MTSAFDWLKENYLPLEEQHSWKTIETLNDPIPIMERFANHRSRELQALIIDFRLRLVAQVKLAPTFLEADTYYNILENYDAFFGIEEARIVKTGE
jgi:hypothetical protein